MRLANETAAKINVDTNVSCLVFDGLLYLPVALVWEKKGYQIPGPSSIEESQPGGEGKSVYFAIRWREFMY